MASYWEQIAAAYNEGYSYDELFKHHAENDMGEPPRPPIERAWDPTPISAKEDWLAAAGPPTSVSELGSLSGPTMDDATANTNPMIAPNTWTTDQSGNNPWVSAGNRADQVAPDINVPGTQDSGEITAPPMTTPDYGQTTFPVLTPDQQPGQDI